MNLNLAENAMVLFTLDDFLFYKDKITAVIVNGFSENDSWRKEYESFFGRTYECAMIGFCPTGEKYIIPLSIDECATLLQNEFKDKSLLVKWGLYKPNEVNSSFKFMSRQPQVVIYNTVNDLQNNFREYFNSGKRGKYIHIGASDDHPFQSIILKDTKGVLHLVNSYLKFISDFIRDNKDNLDKLDFSELKGHNAEYNNAFSVWNGMQWNIDWLETMLNGKELIYRPN